MSKPNGASSSTPPPNPAVNVLGQYIRDLSFENYALQNPEINRKDTRIAVGFDIGVQRRDNNVFEVITKTNLKVLEKESDTQVFLLELEYAGLFRVEGFASEKLQAFLLVDASRMLFPFIRRIANDLIMDGGYAPIPLNPLDFEKIYRQELARRESLDREAN